MNFSITLKVTVHPWAQLWTNGAYNNIQWRGTGQKKKKIQPWRFSAYFAAVQWVSILYKWFNFIKNPELKKEGSKGRCITFRILQHGWKTANSFSPQDCWAAWSQYGGMLWYHPWTRAGSHPGSVGQRGQHRALSLWCTPPEIYTQWTEGGNMDSNRIAYIYHLTTKICQVNIRTSIFFRIYLYPMKCKA